MESLKTKEGMKFLIYSRVSVKGTHETANESSIPMQIGLCEKYVKDHKGIIYETISDDFASGKDLTSRPGMYRIISELENGTAEWDTLIAYSLTRFSRSMKDLQRMFELLKDNNKYMVSIAENIDFSTPVTRLNLNMLCSVAQFWRESSQENVREKMKFMAKDGMYMPGCAPFGYMKKDHTLIPVPEKAEIVLEIFKKYSEGVSVDKLNRIYPQFPTSTLMNMLRNDHYIGKIKWKEERFKGKHPAIVPIDLYNQVQDRLPKSLKNPRLNAQKYRYLLSGLIYCHCGKRLSPRGHYGRNNKYFYYKCTDFKNKRCHMGVSAPVIDKAVLDVLKEAPLKKAELRYLIQLANQEKNRKAENIKPELSGVLDQKIKIQTDIGTVEQLFMNGTVDAGNKDYFNARLADLVAQLKTLDIRRIELESAIGDEVEDIDFDEIIKGIEKFSDALKKTSRVELLQSFIRSRVERIEISKDGKEFSLKLRMGEKLLCEPKWWSIRELNP